MKNRQLFQISACCMALLLTLGACNNNSKSGTASSKNHADSTGKPQVGGSSYIEVKTWLDDFKSFRTAVYQKDVGKLKTYFSFPINADTTQIWDAVYDGEEDDKRPSPFPSTFTEADFDKYYTKLFGDAFIKSLLKVKSEQLYKKGEYTTPLIETKNESFSMVAVFDKATQTLQLNVTYPGGKDEQGNYVSEGEHATIYFFKVKDNKYLMFDKILFAG